MRRRDLDRVLDRRLGKPSAKRVPEGCANWVEELYRERYLGFNARHVVDKGRMPSGIWPAMAGSYDGYTTGSTAGDRGIDGCGRSMRRPARRTLKHEVMKVVGSNPTPQPH